MLSIVHLLVPVCFLGQVVTSSEQAASRKNITACLLPLDEGNCRGLLPQYYYNRYTQMCEEFSYGGCDCTNKNTLMTDSRTVIIVSTLLESRAVDSCQGKWSNCAEVPKICRMEVEPGPCRGYIKRYAYNLLTMKCELFIYGGCYGNDNNFGNEASCLESCSPKRNAPSFCYSPKDEGSCSASVSRYYFNIENKSCEEFQYTGCAGNSNNFIRLEDCINVCKKGNKKPRNKNRIRKPKIQS
ncbi:PREDICTED: tissue factor pathway inhibitor 2 [Nanorana parkeri]|uniref:tissue factor pathway inhibitor 2 n=1 Tax=Nanorana parkeri TaxID=125878 RepID=UPI000854EEF4|nr:PREDICTED: tissue factor pathway inhibitor 2 [Nanorana parkeri]